MSGLRYGIIGPGQIADVFAAALTEGGTGRVAQVLGRRAERAQAFVERHGGEVARDMDALLSSADAVYIATPHAFHGDAVRAAIEGGVPVLCEKPLTLDPAETASLVELARRRAVPLMEAWMYRTHPQMQAVFDELRRGRIGTVQRVESEFAFHCPYDPEHRLFAPELGGGVVLDVGGYPISVGLGVARAVTPDWDHALAAARLRDIDGTLAPTGVDRTGSAILDVAGIEVRMTVATNRVGGMSACIIGSDGVLEIEQPFMPEGERRGRNGRMHVIRAGHTESVSVESKMCAFGHEAAAFATLVRGWKPGTGGAPIPTWPLVDHDETMAIARLMDDWRKGVLAIGASSPSV